jgi:hypothetical protein
MKKLRLDLDELVVESFVTRAEPQERGTVQGQQNVLLSIVSPLGCVATALFSCGCTVADTCPESCQWSCGASCGPACQTRNIGTCNEENITHVNLTNCQTQWYEEDEAQHHAEN